VKAERARVTALQALDKPATHEIVMKAIADGKQPSDIIAECLTAMEKVGTQQARRTDASTTSRIPGSESGDTNEQTAFAASLTKHVKARAKAVRPNFSRN
jgi:hypothetical protein